MQNPAAITLNAIKGPTNSFDQAKHVLTQEKMVVITGVQGSGKTFLARSLVNDLKKDVIMKYIVFIISLNHLYWGPSEKTDIYILDDIFYELQLYEKFQVTLSALKEFLDRVGYIYLIITIPS